MLLIDVSKNSREFSALSPHVMGPVALTASRVAPSIDVAWQSLLVYPEHVGVLNLPTDDWLRWSDDVLKGKAAIPAGEPLYAYIDGERIPVDKAFNKWYRRQYITRAYDTGEWHELRHRYLLHYRQLAVLDGGEGHGRWLMEMLSADLS